MPLLMKYMVLVEDYKMHKMIFNGLEYHHCNIIKYCGFFLKGSEILGFGQVAG